MAEKISKEDFVIRAIKKLRKEPYKGIHSVYSGFNQAFRAEFKDDPIKTTNRMAEEGKIFIRPVKGGVMLYLPEDAPASLNVQAVIKKIKEN
jgi:hypothetical protein